MFLKLKDNELNIKTPKKIKTMECKIQFDLGQFCCFFIVYSV